MKRKFSVGDKLASGTIVSIPNDRPGFYNVQCDLCGLVRLKQTNKTGCRECNKKNRKKKKYNVGDRVPAGIVVGDSNQSGKYLIRCDKCGYVRKTQATTSKCRGCYSKNRIKYAKGSKIDGILIKDVNRDGGHPKILISCKQCKKDVWKTPSSMSSVCKKCKDYNLSLKMHNKNVVKKISSYKNSAKKRKYLWEIENSFAQDLFESECFYCGHSPSPLNGIDRKNNSIGYTVENCVSCCKKCNIAKSNMEYDEWETWINRISEFRNRMEK